LKIQTSHNALLIPVVTDPGVGQERVTPVLARIPWKHVEPDSVHTKA
jgi:hypothetical protein